MARAIQLGIGQRWHWFNTDQADPEIRLIMEGRPVEIGKIPPVIQRNEPEPIGAQVRASKRGGEIRVEVWTKIGVNRWVQADASPQYGATVVVWSELQIYEVISPKPKKEELPPAFDEPTQFAAVVIAEPRSPHVEEPYQDFFSRASAGFWVDSAGDEWTWDALTPIELVFEGVGE